MNNWDGKFKVSTINNLLLGDTVCKNDSALLLNKSI